MTLRRLALAGAAAGAGGLAFGPVFGHALEAWRLDPELSFGFFGVPAAAAMTAARFRQLVAVADSGEPIGILVFAVGVVVLLAGDIAGVHALAGTAFLPITLGAAIYVFGVPAAKLLAPQLAIVTLTLSLYRGMLSSVGFPLQQLTANLASGLAGFVVTGVHRSGVDIYVGAAHFVVVQACSGMDSLLALLFLGLLVMAFTTATWPTRIALLAAALPIVVLTNVLRVTLVLVSSAGSGLNLESGALHSALSAAAFLVAGSLFAAAAVALRCTPRLRAA